MLNGILTMLVILEGMVLFVTGDRHVGVEKIPACLLQDW